MTNQQKEPSITLPRPLFLILCKPPPPPRRPLRAVLVDAIAIMALIIMSTAWAVFVARILYHLAPGGRP